MRGSSIGYVRQQGPSRLLAQLKGLMNQLFCLMQPSRSYNMHGSSSYDGDNQGNMSCSLGKEDCLQPTFDRGHRIVDRRNIISSELGSGNVGTNDEIVG